MPKKTKQEKEASVTVSPKSLSGNLSDYEYFRQTALNHPLLSKEEEEDIGKKMLLGRAIEATPEQKQAAEEAKKELIEHNMRLVDSVAQTYKATGAPIMDLIESAYTGLLIAAESFDYRYGRFSTYATRGMKNQLNEFRLDAHLIHIPKEKASLISKINQAAVEYSSRTGEEISDEQLAEQLGVDIEDISKIRNIPHSVGRLDDPIGEDDDGGEVLDLVKTDGKGPEEIAQERGDAEVLLAHVDELPEMQRRVIRESFGLDGTKEKTLNQIGAELGISGERARQIKGAGIANLKNLLTKDKDD